MVESFDIEKEWRDELGIPGSNSGLFEIFKFWRFEIGKLEEGTVDGLDNDTISWSLHKIVKGSSDDNVVVVLLHDDTVKMLL